MRRYAQTQARGAVLIVGRTQTESRFDSVLRVFDTLGNKLAIPREHLSGMALELRPNADSSFRRKVAAITLTTRDRVPSIEAHKMPKHSRTRVLVPDAAHYLPDHFDDDYMQWANGFVYLVGVPKPECGGINSVNLTGDSFRRTWTPVHFYFPG